MDRPRIFFWQEREDFGWMSNFWPGPYLIEGQEWPTTEHYFAAQKTTDPKLKEAVRHAISPLHAKRLGRAMVLRPDWDEVKYEVMKTALRAKFSHEPLRSQLIATNDALIYEDSPFDKVWGTGKRGDVGTGKNLLGKALMEIREELKTDGV